MASIIYIYIYTYIIMALIVQSIRFKRTEWNKSESNKWIRNHGYIIIPEGKLNKQYKLWRAYRQVQPKLMTDFRTIKESKNGIIFIVGKMK
jgi:hypothetical protein